MHILEFFIHLAGAIMLLLFAIRMVRTGVERLFGNGFKDVMAHVSNPVSSVAVGGVLALILQSSAAVALLVAGFISSGFMGFTAGVSSIIGADIGSALLVQILSFDLSWLMPICLALGGILFVKFNKRTVRQTGRIILGIAFVLIALRFLREVMAPIATHETLPMIMGYLQQDFITTFLLGIFLAWLLHSSIATILICVSLVAVNAMPLLVGIYLIFGANLGSSLIPVWLGRDQPPDAKRTLYGALIIRGFGAIVALLLFKYHTMMTYVDTTTPAESLIYVHVIFNMVLVFMLPFCPILEKALKAVIPDEVPSNNDVNSLALTSVLSHEKEVDVPMTFSLLKREVLGMLHQLENMSAPMLDVYQSHDKEEMKKIDVIAENLQYTLDGIRQHLSKLPYEDLGSKDKQNIYQLTQYSMALATAADIMKNRLLPYAKKKKSKKASLNDADLKSVADVHQHIMTDLTVASDLLLTENTHSARVLVERKKQLLSMVRNNREQYVKRILKGDKAILKSNDGYVKILLALQDMNSQIATFAYAHLAKEGQLLNTRLVPDETDKQSV